jgi:hypothetical protein
MAPYQYGAPFVSRLAPTIGDLLLNQGAIAAKGATDIGAANARATELSGQAWAQATQNAAATIAAIPQTMRANAAAEQERKIRDLQIADANNKIADQKSLDAAFSTPGAMDEIINRLPGHMRGTVQKQFAEAQELALKIKKGKQDTQQFENDYAAHLAATIRDHNYDPTAAGLALSHAKTVYGDDPHMMAQFDQLQQVIASNPEQIKPLVDSIISGSAKQQEIDIKSREAAARERTADTGARHLEAQIPLINAQTAAENLKVDMAPTEKQLKIAQLAHINAQLDGSVPLTAKDRAELTLQRDRLAAEQKHWSNEDSQAAAAPALTPEALDLTAKQYAMTGLLPPMGNGKQGANVRSTIINRAADMYKNLDLPTQVAAYTANKESLKKAQATLDTVAGFEKVAGKNLDQFLSLASKVPDTGVPWLNTPIRNLDEKVVGSTNVAAFKAARDVALREIARVTSDPKLSGALTDSARAEVQALSPEGATFAQIKAVARVLKQDMANVHDGLSSQISDIQQRIATPPGQQPAQSSPATPAAPAAPALTPGLQRLMNR